MQLVKQIAGEWIRDSDMHPTTNIAGRKFWSPGIEGCFSGYWPTKDGMKPENLWWHFPNMRSEETDNADQ